MKKLLLLLIHVYQLISTDIKTETTQPNEAVYICTKSKLKIYHRNPKCRELRKQCNASSIRRITLKQAEQMKQKACKICFRLQNN